MKKKTQINEAERKGPDDFEKACDETMLMIATHWRHYAIKKEKQRRKKQGGSAIIVEYYTQQK